MRFAAFLIPLLFSQDVPFKLAPHPRIWIDKAALPQKDRKPLRESKSLLNQALIAYLDGDADAVAFVKKEVRRGVPDETALMERAAAYDWIHGRLDLEQRTALANALIDQAVAVQDRVSRGGYAVYQSGIVAAPMAVSMAALAAWDEDVRCKALHLWAQPYVQMFFKITGDGAKPEELDGRALRGGGWPEGFDLDRSASRPLLMYFHALRSATGEDRISESSYWKDKIAYLIYGTLPDRKHMYAGDDNACPTTHRHDRELMLMLNAIFKDGHAQRWIRECAPPVPESAAFDLLFGDASIPEKEFKELPTARHFSGIGLAVLRSSWEKNASYVTFRAGDWFSPRQHNAQGSVTLFRQGPLLIEPGVVDRPLSPYSVNWRWRTISHNSLLVRDPAEKFSGPKGGPAAANDGGQFIQQAHDAPSNLEEWRRQSQSVPRNTAAWLAFESTPDFDFAAADCFRAYGGTKVSQFLRCVLYVKPNWLILVDRIVSDARLPKTLVFHAPNSITLNEKRREAAIDNPARMHVRFVWPDKAKVSIVGDSEPSTAYPGAEMMEAPPATNGQIAGARRFELLFFEGEMNVVTAFYFPEKPASKAPDVKLTKNTSKTVQIELEKSTFDISIGPKPRAKKTK